MANEMQTKARGSLPLGEPAVLFLSLEDSRLLDRDCSVARSLERSYCRPELPLIYDEH